MRKLSQINERLFNSGVKRAMNNSARLGDTFASNIMEIKTVDLGHPTLLFADRLLVIDDGLTDEIQYNHEWMDIHDEVEGKGWRLPTIDEAKEIMEIFDFSQPRKDTMTVTSKINGESVNYRQIANIMIGWFMLEKTDACKKDGSVPAITYTNDKFHSEKVRIQHASDYLGLNVILVKEKKVNERLFGSGTKRAMLGGERLESIVQSSNIRELNAVDLGDADFLWADEDLEINGESWFDPNEVMDFVDYIEQHGWSLPKKQDFWKKKFEADAIRVRPGGYVDLPTGEHVVDVRIKAWNDELGTEVLFPDWNTTLLALDQTERGSNYVPSAYATALDYKLVICVGSTLLDKQGPQWMRIRLIKRKDNA